MKNENHSIVFSNYLDTYKEINTDAGNYDKWIGKSHSQDNEKQCW